MPRIENMMRLRIETRFNRGAALLLWVVLLLWSFGIRTGASAANGPRSVAKLVRLSDTSCFGIPYREAVEKHVGDTLVLLHSPTLGLGEYVRYRPPMSPNDSGRDFRISAMRSFGQQGTDSVEIILNRVYDGATFSVRIGAEEQYVPGFVKKSVLRWAQNSLTGRRFWISRIAGLRFDSLGTVTRNSSERDRLPCYAEVVVQQVLYSDAAGGPLRLVCTDRTGRIRVLDVSLSPRYAALDPGGFLDNRLTWVLSCSSPTSTWWDSAYALNSVLGFPLNATVEEVSRSLGDPVHPYRPSSRKLSVFTDRSATRFYGIDLDSSHLIVGQGGLEEAELFLSPPLAQADGVDVVRDSLIAHLGTPTIAAAAMLPPGLRTARENGHILSSTERNVVTYKWIFGDPASVSYTLSLIRAVDRVHLSILRNSASDSE